MLSTAARVRIEKLAALAFVTATLGLVVWRGACVLAGPDIDTDAYAHHMIARAILKDPSDLAVNWVWLPLFHYIQVPLVLCGGTMTAVRWCNVALAAMTPAVLFLYVRATAVRGNPSMSPDAAALLAGLIAAACPIAMQMGTTAQPEPLFALLVLGVAIACEKRRHAAGAAMLSAAVMLRYEAWAILAVVAAFAGFDTWRRPNAERGAGVWWCVALPAALIFGWAALRRPVDGRWFGFLGETHQFAAGALGAGAERGRGFFGVVGDALYYPVAVPFRVLGPALALVPFGVARTVRQQGARFVGVLSAGLAFISLTWVMRSSLGLDRHFVSVVPLYACFAAQGAGAIADGAVRMARRGGLQAAPALWMGRASGALVSLAVLGGLGVELAVWMGFWKQSIERGWPERAAVGAYLRSLPASASIFCDDATIEILSGIDRRRFDRHFIDDPHTWDIVEDAAERRGVAYIATWSRKLRGHDNAGIVVFRAGQDPSDPGTGVAIMRIEGDAHSTAR